MPPRAPGRTRPSGPSGQGGGHDALLYLRCRQVECARGTYQVVRSTLRQIIARNVRLLREGRGWSQEALADQCGLHRTYVGAIERGEHNLTIRTVERLADALEVHPAQLLREIRGPRCGRP